MLNEKFNETSNPNQVLPTLESNWLALSLVPKLGIQTLKQLLGVFGSVDAILHTSAKVLHEKGGISESLAKRIQQATSVTSFQMEQRLIQNTGVQLLCMESQKYPENLKQIPALPSVLYVKGNVDCLSKPSIAFVGSRSCSNYGLQQTRRFVEDLAKQWPDVVIVSGLAKGIDTIAHQVALECGLQTIAVLAGGLQHIYPAENKALAEQITQQGALVSEFPLALKPVARNFPIRNRIISGLSQGVIVTEANPKSGALITAAFSLQQDREVFAIPGNIDMKSSQGTNQLIARGHAKLVMSVSDVLEELQLRQAFKAPTAVQEELPFEKELKLLDHSTLPEKQQLLLKSLWSRGTQSMDQLFENTQIGIHELLGMLVELEIHGYVQMLPDQRYQFSSEYRLED